MEPLDPGPRTLMGPGPSDVPSRVLRAMATPVVGHLDPYFLGVMDRVREMLRWLFRTENESTLPVPGTGTAGLEACLANLIEPGDPVVVGVNGHFGARMAEIAGRHGGRVFPVEAPWGEIVPPAEMAAAIERERPAVVALVHAETSTGVLQPVEEIATAADGAGALLVLDCVTSLGGLPVEIDGWGVDAAYSGTQKCLSAPPGLSPVTLSARAMEKVEGRTTKPCAFYLDLTLLERYWGGDRAYHHTAPVSSVFALYEALGIVFEEGLDERFARHRRVHEALVSGLSERGLSLLGRENHRLPMLNAVAVPDGTDEADVRRRLLAEHGIEIGAGLGPLAGKIWRVGIMGASCTEEHVDRFLAALDEAL